MTDPATTPSPTRSGYPAELGDGRDYLIRSEEQLHVDTQRIPAGYARLEKFLVTELRTITVEVTHEEIRLVHETEETSQTGRHTGRSAQMNTARWIYVNREEIVISKRIIPVERVRLEVYSVNQERQIIEQVQKEQIQDVQVTPPAT